MIDKLSLTRLFCYMASSARGCIDEPKIYGPFRILDSMTKIFRIWTESGLAFDGELSEVVSKIEESKYKCMTNEAEFVSMLDEIVNDLAGMLS